MTLIDADKLKQHYAWWNNEEKELFDQIVDVQPTVEQKEWIGVKDRLPKDLKPVNVVWVNRKPEPYYENIKDKPFVATAVYFKGQWYWWSCVAEDLLAEYGKSIADEMDKSIEILFWMPLPKPPKEEEQ